jgi:alkyl sulfatase BDS1-like metallo-beta-lactamase superfamily hydrolase
VLNDIQLGKTTLDKAVADGSAKIDGNAAIVSDFLASMDSFKFWFNIVTP